ncbi:MAG: hypothetical protein ACPGYV_11870, partial [Phycisphaeraceae bacterium]
MTQPSVIGLDIGRSAIKAVQLRPSDKGPAVEGRLLIERSSGGANPTPAEAERLSRAMDRRGMSATRVVMVAPSDALVAASVDVPPMDSKVPRDKIVEMELCRTQRLTPGTFELAWWDLPKSASGATITQAHALALPHNAIEETLEILAGIDLNVIRTVSGSMAHSALAQRHPIDPRCISAVLDLGTTQGHLSLMYAGRVVHERGLPDFNPLDVRRQFASTLGIDEPTAKRAIGRYGISDEPSGSVACVSASLLGEALGVDRVELVHIDNGLMRKGESRRVIEELAELGLEKSVHLI